MKPKERRKKKEQRKMRTKKFREDNPKPKRPNRGRANIGNKTVIMRINYPFGRRNKGIYSKKVRGLDDD